MRPSSFALLVALSGAGCSEEDCLDPLPECQPLYQPTFSNVYTNTLSVSCAVGQGTCHTADGAARANNLFLGAEDAAYEGLTGQSDGVKRAIAADAECSVLIQRLESDDPDIQMPPGSKLSAAERCSIIQWVQSGTPR